MSKVFISYRHVDPDQLLASELDASLKQEGHETFIDTRLTVGLRWQEEIDGALRSAAFFVILLSKESMTSTMVHEEVRRANLYGLKILPVRLGYRGELPYELGAILNPIQYALWEEDAAFAEVARQIVDSVNTAAPLPVSPAAAATAETLHGLADAIDSLGAPLAAADPRLMQETGTLRLTSKFYIERPVDWLLTDSLSTAGVTVIVSGPRQSGKSSLLARSHGAARKQGQVTAYVDFQLISDESRPASLDALLQSLAWKLAEEFSTSIQPDSVWKTPLPQSNLLRFLETAILATNSGPILLFLDEVDSVFRYSFRQNFFAMIRGWHNRRATHPQYGWDRLTLVLGHATDPSLWIQGSETQSPFNIGVRVQMDDFTAQDVASLCARHGLPQTDNIVARIMAMVAGHPFLVRQALYALRRNGWTLSQLEAASLDERGPFGDHLRHYNAQLQQHPELKVALSQILGRARCDSDQDFDWLKAAGLVTGSTRIDAAMRCGLYRDFYRRLLA